MVWSLNYIGYWIGETRSSFSAPMVAPVIDKEVVETETSFLALEVEDTWLYSIFSGCSSNTLSDSGLLQVYFNHH